MRAMRPAGDSRAAGLTSYDSSCHDFNAAADPGGRGLPSQYTGTAFACHPRRITFPAPSVSLAGVRDEQPGPLRIVGMDRDRAAEGAALLARREARQQFAINAVRIHADLHLHPRIRGCYLEDLERPGGTCEHHHRIGYLLPGIDRIEVDPRRLRRDRVRRGAKDVQLYLRGPLAVGLDH